MIILKRRSMAILLPAMISLVFILCPEVPAQAQRDISSVTVKPSLSQTPDISSGNVPSLGSPAKWIQVDVDFTTALKSGPMGKNYFEWIDDIRVEMDIILPTGHPKRTHALLTGKTDYWAFVLDGKEHHLVMFVPPNILERWAPAQKFSGADLKKLEIKVTFKRNDAVIAVAYHVPRGRTETDVAKLFLRVAGLPDIDRVRNGIYSVDKTPWAHLNFDYYELVKTTKSED